MASTDASLHMGVSLGQIKTRSPYRAPDYLGDPMVKKGLSGADLWAAVDQFESGLRSN